MPAHRFIVRLFLTSGGLLAVIGLILWLTLPITSRFPPYLGTALLALGYGTFCSLSARFASAGKS